MEKGEEGSESGAEEGPTSRKIVDSGVRLGRCPNCGSVAQRQFCPECGQSTRSPRGPLPQLVHDLAGSLFSLDSRVFRSLPTLLLRPGQLTLDFLQGKRSSQVPPVRLYLVASLAFFFLFQHPSPDVKTSEVWIDDVQISPQPEGQGARRTEIGLTSNSALGRRLKPTVHEKVVTTLAEMGPQPLLNRLFGAIEDGIPTALFLFLPLLAVVLKVLFFGARRFYFDHLVFALHFQSFLFLALIGAYVLRHTSLFLYAVVFALVLAAPIYFAMAARIVYGQPWWKVLLKTVLTAAAYLVLAYVAYVGVMISALLTI